MLDSLSILQKKGAVVLLFIVMLLGAYFFSFKKTIELKKELSNKKELVQNLDVSKLEIEKLKRILSENSLDLKMDETALQNALLEDVSQFCETEKKMEIKAFLPVHEFLLDNKTVHTCSFSVSADFFNLLKLHAHLEKSIKNAVLASIEYEMNSTRNSKELVATYHVQNLSQK